MVRTAGSIFSPDTGGPLRRRKRIRYPTVGPTIRPTLAHYFLDGNTNDGSGNDNHGTPTDVSYIAGKINQAASFNGSSSYVRIPSAGLDTTPQLTIALWMKRIDISAYIIAKRDGLPSTEQYAITILSSANTRFRILGTSYVDSNTPCAYDQWEHQVVTVKGTTVLWYHNGEPDGDGTLSESIPSKSSDVFFAARGNGIGGATLFTAVSLDDVRIYDGALEEWEIALIYNNGEGTQREI